MTASTKSRVWIRPNSVGASPRSLDRRAAEPLEPLRRSTAPGRCACRTPAGPGRRRSPGRRSAGRGTCRRRGSSRRACVAPDAYIRRRRLRVPRTSKVRSTSSRPSGLRPAPPCSSRSASSRCSAMSASRPVQSMTKSAAISQRALSVRDDARDHLVVRSGRSSSTLPVSVLVPALAAARAHLLLPAAAVRRVGAADHLVELRPAPRPRAAASAASAARPTRTSDS